MAPTIIRTATLIGITGHSVNVDVDLVRRLPAFVVVGMAEGAVRETADRIRSAIQYSGFEVPRQRIVVNLTPNDVPKTNAVDLAVAVGVMWADSTSAPEHVQERLATTAFLGELSLSGDLRPTRGLRSLIEACRDAGATTVVVPSTNKAEASAVTGVEVLVADCLSDVRDWVKGGYLLTRAQALDLTPLPGLLLDMADVHGNEKARRALEIAAAGGHSILLTGPAGCGKTMLAARLPGILPPLTLKEQEDVTRVQSAAGLLPVAEALVLQRPFRAPHHTISAAGMVGSASFRPGEITLAHNGVLFLDELPEFSRAVLEQIPGCIEARVVVITRAEGSTRLPMDALLVGGASLCPCGYSETSGCRCSPELKFRYQARSRQPNLFQMEAQCERVSREELGQPGSGESSAEIQKRVIRAREAQAVRGCLNARLAGARIPPELSRMARETAWSMDVLRVARTIADLAGEAEISEAHAIEAATFVRPPGVPQDAEARLAAARNAVDPDPTPGASTRAP